MGVRLPLGLQTSAEDFLQISIVFCCESLISLEQQDEGHVGQKAAQYLGRAIAATQEEHWTGRIA